MWQVVERAQIAARPGLVWRAVREIAGSSDDATTRIEVEEAPRELAWTTLVPVDGDGDGEPAEVLRWFRLAPSWNGTEAEHGVRIARPPTDPEQLDLRARAVATLAAVKARSEAAS